MPLLSLDGIVDLLAMHCDIAWSLDSKAYLVTPDFDYHKGNRIADDDLFVYLSGEYQHKNLLPLVPRLMTAAKHKRLHRHKARQIGAKTSCPLWHKSWTEIVRDTATRGLGQKLYEPPETERYTWSNHAAGATFAQS